MFMIAYSTCTCTTERLILCSLVSVSYTCRITCTCTCSNYSRTFTQFIDKFVTVNYFVLLIIAKSIPA